MMTINKYFNRRSLCSLSNVNVHISSIRVSCSAADRHEIEMQHLHKNYMMYTNRNRSGSDKIDFGWGLSSSKSFAFCCASLICRGSCRRKWTFAIEKFQRIDTRRCCEKWQSQSPFAFPFAISFNELPLVDVSLFVYTIKQTHAPLSEFIHTISSDWILRSDHFLDQLLPCRLSVDCLTVVHFKRLSRTSHQTVADYTLKAPKQESASLGWFDDFG